MLTACLAVCKVVIQSNRFTFPSVSDAPESAALTGNAWAFLYPASLEHKNKCTPWEL